MNSNLTDTLCTRCGLCCDGSLFADVELASRAETSALEVMGLEVEDAETNDRGLLLQPCRALKARRCSIYPYRPNCCRTFECRLLQEVKLGVVGVDRATAKIAAALQQINRVKKLVVQLGNRDESLPLKERCEEALALFNPGPENPELDRKRTGLQAAMNSVERLIQETFLGT